MRNYEIAIMIHPDHSDQVPSIIEKYTKIIEDGKGIIHRCEDWGRRQLAYGINKLHKAHYLLFNIESEPEVTFELEKDFTFNDMVLRSLVIKVKKPIKEPSIMLKSSDEKASSKRHMSPSEIK